MKRILIYGDDKEGALALYSELLKKTERVTVFLCSGDDADVLSDEVAEMHHFLAVRVTYKNEDLVIEPPKYVELNFQDNKENIDSIISELIYIIDHENWRAFGEFSLILEGVDGVGRKYIRDMMIQEGWNILKKHTTRERSEEEVMGLEYFFRRKEDFDNDSSLVIKYKYDEEDYGLRLEHIVEPFVCIMDDNYGDKLHALYPRSAVVDVITTEGATRIEETKDCYANLYVNRAEGDKALMTALMDYLISLRLKADAEETEPSI